jgi:hypothetical protein
MSKPGGTRQGKGGPWDKIPGETIGKHPGRGVRLQGLNNPGLEQAFGHYSREVQMLLGPI